jgi:hypothetical protein
MSLRVPGKPKILVGIVSRNAICNHSHSCRDFLICAKSHQACDVSPLGKKSRIVLASFYYFYEEGSAHSIPSLEEVRWIHRCLREVVLQQHLVPEMVDAMDAKTADRRSSPSLSVHILKLLHGEDHHHHLLPIVLEQRLYVRVVGRGRILEQKFLARAQIHLKIATELG